MADITVKGWANKGQSKESAKGGFSAFTLAESQKQKDGSYSKVFYNVTNFNEKAPPADGSKVQVTGYLKMRAYESNGEKRTSYDVVANAIEVLEQPKPREENTAGSPEAEKDPFDL